MGLAWVLGRVMIYDGYIDVLRTTEYETKAHRSEWMSSLLSSALVLRVDAAWTAASPTVQPLATLMYSPERVLVEPPLIGY